MRGLKLAIAAATATPFSLGFGAPAFAVAGPLYDVVGAVQPSPSGLARRVAPSPALEFRGARLGMTIEDWKSLPFPGKSSDPVSRTCKNGPAGIIGAGLSGESSKPTAPVEICSYASPDETDKSFTLTKTYLVRRPQYDFVNGQLSKIEFHSSINAFNDVMALLDGTYGPATQTLRDSVKVVDGFDMPRVQMIWRRTNGTIQLVDPSSTPAQLVVRFAAR